MRTVRTTFNVFVFFMAVALFSPWVWATEDITIGDPVVNPADPAAAIIGAIFVVLGALKVPERLNLSAAQVTMILSAIMMVAASVRTWVSG